MEHSNVQMHYLGSGGARRAPMNQDEFDTKFNFLKEARSRYLSVDDPNINPQSCCWCFGPNNNNRRKYEQADQISMGKAKLVRPRYELDGMEIDEEVFHKKQFYVPYLPLIGVVQRYNLKEKLFGDMRSGIVLGMHSIVEGFAFAFIAGLPPIYGIYTTIFAAIIYAFVGTSTFSFMGTNVIVCLLIRNIIQRHSSTYDQIYMLNTMYNNKTNNAIEDKIELLTDAHMDLLQFSSTLTFLTALIQGLIYFFRVEFVFCYLSEQLISGFSLGVAIRLILNQLQHILQIRTKTCINDMALTVTAFSSKFSTKQNLPPTENFKECFLWVIYRKLYGNTTTKGSLENFYSFTTENANSECLPSAWECLELINMNTVIISVISLLILLFARQFLNPWLRCRFKLPFSFEFIFILIANYMAYFFEAEKHNVETIKYVIQFTYPNWRLLKAELFFDAFAMALFTYALHLHILSHFKRKQKQKINDRQICNYFVVLTMLTALVWPQFYFGSLPVIIFGSAALLAIFLTNLSFALFCAILFSAFTIVLRSQWYGLLYIQLYFLRPVVQLLVNVTGSGSYYAEKCFYGSDMLDESGVAVVRYDQLLGIGIGTRTGSMKSMKSTNATCILTAPGGGGGGNQANRSTLLISGDIVPNYDQVNPDHTAINKVLILDLSSTPIIDSTGIGAIKEVYNELADKKVRLLLACANSLSRTRFKLSGGYETIPKYYFFPSVHDAVLCAQQLGGIMAPSIHMSVSMNGCRDLITLSTATSNHDLEGHNQASENPSGFIPVGSRPSIPSLASGIMYTNAELNPAYRSTPSPSSIKLKLKKSNS